MIRAVIFDLNGVFIQSPKLSDRFAESFRVPQEEFLPALQEIMPKIRMPNAGSAFAYWKPYLEKWDINLTEKEFFNFWFNAEKEVPELVALARSLKNRGLKIFILSNNFQERAEYYDRRHSFLKEIAEKIYYSWQTGLVKSNPEAYEKILIDNNLKPKECIYFDDVEKNIELARGLGIQSYLFNGIDGIMAAIENR